MSTGPGLPCAPRAAPPIAKAGSPSERGWRLSHWRPAGSAGYVTDASLCGIDEDAIRSTYPTSSMPPSP
eukprot:5540797-Pyramimonas_sp.AAC.1